MAEPVNYEPDDGRLYPFVPVIDVPDDTPPPILADLLPALAEYLDVEERRALLKKLNYREQYLRSDHWRAARKVAIQRAGYRCQRCGATGRLDAHHLTYQRLGAEDDQDLEVLCRPCHDGVASRMRRLHTRNPLVAEERSRLAARVQRQPESCDVGSPVNELGPLLGNRRHTPNPSAQHHPCEQWSTRRRPEQTSAPAGNRRTGAISGEGDQNREGLVGSRGSQGSQTGNTHRTCGFPHSD